MKRILSLLLACVLTAGLTGCGSVFNRSYSSITVHQEQAASDEDASILRAESYSDLVSCVQHFVSIGQETGTVHVYKYTGDIASDLETACHEVLTEDPLGAYALEDITFDYSRIVSYYECTFVFTYRHTLEEMDSISIAYSRVAIRELMEQAMSEFDQVLTIRTTSYYASPTELYSLAQDAYYASPATALGYPDLSVSIYPDSGDVRIIEIQFQYGASQSILLQRSEAVAAAASLLAGQDTAADDTVAWLLCSRLGEHTQYDSSGSASVYNALCTGSANSEGIALSYELLCSLAGISCQMVQGALYGVPHCWNLITLEGTSWMLDVTGDEEESHFLHNDDVMSQLGYSWSREDYPSCDGPDGFLEEEEPSDAEEGVGTTDLPSDSGESAEPEDRSESPETPEENLPGEGDSNPEETPSEWEPVAASD